MAYFVENEDGTRTLHPSPNVKVFMKLEEPEATYNLFEKSVEDIKAAEGVSIIAANPRLKVFMKIEDPIKTDNE